jgi:F0F1-type ATP synthase assembly protein I
MPDDDSSPSAYDLLTLGLTMAILVGGGLGLGILVDDWLGSSPIATFVGLFLGVTFAGLALWERARRYL